VAKNDESPLLLWIEPTAVVCRSGRQWTLQDGAAFVARLKNVGARPLTLVSPGDGSRMGRRTPTVTWTFNPGGIPPVFEGCGNLNSLKEGEVFVLQPGAERIFERWIAPLVVPIVPCRGVMTYSNDPRLPFLGSPLGPNDEAELLRLQGSDVCQVSSNEVEFVRGAHGR
jgi:hypothetical protein